MKFSIQTLIGLGLLLSFGCTPPPSSTLGLVTGTVFYDGKPVPNLALEFHPVSGGRPSLAFTNERGHFEAIYLANVPGAVIGSHTIRYEMTPGELPADISPAEMLKVQRPDFVDDATLRPDEVRVLQGTNHFELRLVPPPPPENVDPIGGEALEEVSNPVDPQVPATEATSSSEIPPSSTDQIEPQLEPPGQ
ncbi:carboxypeptidase regulatory-like domain-containing protein [Crateriforma spongiae]|uniref:carboxypeptidase regulatory-like domain-containing protein n=1 Tax=Crateriforma spongiae TaxID=2724528 RepID=UPI0014460651|nr:carboxypeptidase regulatory-like domain-containing protein [Crateriforma spongiae]